MITQTILQYLGAIGTLYVLWLLYIVAMALSRVKKDGTLTMTQKILGYPIVIFGFLLDVLVNLTICTVFFTDIPREWTVSARLTRYYEGGQTGWRFKVAEFVLTQLLDNIDPKGKHRAST